MSDLRACLSALRLSIVGRCQSVSLTRANVEEHNRDLDAILASLPAASEVTRAAEETDGCCSCGIQSGGFFLADEPTTGGMRWLCDDAGACLSRGAILAGQGAGLTEEERATVAEARTSIGTRGTVDDLLAIIDRLAGGAK